MKINIVQFVSTLPNFQVSGLCEQLGGRILPFIFFSLKVTNVCIVTLLVLDPAWSFWVNGKILFKKK